MSAFTIAFQVPNLVRSLFADAALQPAFIPVFTEQLEQKNYREAFRLASTLLLLVTLVLGAITALFVLARAADHAALRARLLGRDPRPHGHPLAGPLPDPDPARGQRHRRRHPQQLRPLRRLRDRAVLLERDDHRRPRPRRADVPRPGPHLRLRDRDPRRHPGPAADPGLRPAQHAVRVQPQLRLAQPRRAPRAAADAAGDPQPRPDQLQPADQQPLRQPRQRRRRRRRSTRRSASTSCRRGSSRWRSRPSSSRPWPASPRAASTTTCGRRWRTGCARSSSS